MSFIVKAVIGHDNIVGLARLTPQPWAEVPTYNVWVPSSIGDQPNGALFSKLTWDGDMIPDDLQSVLTQLGLNVTAMPVAVTLTLPIGAARTTGYFNCYVSYPKTMSYRFFFSSPSLDVRIVEQIA
ncbi:MAG: hypothetical protein KF716_08810 [Anaerolineae bacterium]|nr:hypothetical protein [Anaerolineae bacterium]